MLELDAVVRENQLNCLPISKSGRVEAELLSTYPELSRRIERNKRVMIDVVSLQSRLHERDSRQGTAARAKADLLEDFAPPPSMQKDQRRRTSKDNGGTPKSPSLLARKSPASATSKSPVIAPSRSPMLSAKKSNDLMFEMDEYDDGNGALKTPKCRHQHTIKSPRIPTSGLGLDDDDAFPTTQFSRSPGATMALSNSTKSLASYDASNGPEENQPRYASGEQRPWASASFHTPKLDMKDIMTQTSSSRTSKISSALKSASHPRNPSSASLPTKTSQKERRRQQQRQTSQTFTAVTQSSPNLTAKQSSPKNPTSPWQVATTAPKVNLREVLNVEGNTPTAPKAVEVQTLSPMTLRQTVSGKPLQTQRSASGPARPVSPAALQQRSSFSESIPSSPQLVSASSQRMTSVPAMQSTRHIAASAEPSLQLSMADILAQQNREREIIKEAATKRSLQEIQEEQAFQEWWDLESKKAKEKEAAQKSAIVASRRGKAGTSRSKTSRRGRGEGGKGKERDDDGAVESSTTVQGGFNIDKKREKGRGRSQ